MPFQKTFYVLSPDIWFANLMVTICKRHTSWNIEKQQMFTDVFPLMAGIQVRGQWELQVEHSCSLLVIPKLFCVSSLRGNFFFFIDLGKVFRSSCLYIPVSSLKQPHCPLYDQSKQRQVEGQLPWWGELLRWHHEKPSLPWFFLTANF